jgi:hypothetical protein
MNTSESPITVEIKLKKDLTNFPIFHYRKVYVHDAPNDKIKDEEKEFLADTLENYSHFKYTIPAHSAVEIGELQNDKYEKYNQYFINGRIFNLESLVINSAGKETKIVPETFDAYFKKGKHGEIYYYVK